jgi:hypothetical protein
MKAQEAFFIISDKRSDVAIPSVGTLLDSSAFGRTSA